MRQILASLNEVISEFENSGNDLEAKELNNLFIKISNKFDPKFIDPVGLSDKDIYPDLDVPSKFDPKFIDPVGLSDKDKYPDIDLMSFKKTKKVPFKIKRVK